MTTITQSIAGPDANAYQDIDLAPIPSLSLRTFVEEAGRAIRQTLPQEAWVDAVVLDAKSSKYGFSLELVEPGVDNPANSAFLRAFISTRAVPAIESEIGFTIDCDLLKGTHARLLITPSFHIRYHLQGKITALDPALAESLIVKRIRQIRDQLAAEGVLDAQKRFRVPADVTQIAVIHPDQSAGWADIRSELEHLERLGLLTVHSFPATFEGPQAAASLRTALADVLVLSQKIPFDLVLIIRGGGASAGLAALADLGIARQICRMPVPVVTGLGHASDHSLLDEIAWRATDTPSKALHLVKSILRQRADEAIVSREIILGTIERTLEQIFRPQLSSKLTELQHGFEKVLSSRRDALRDSWFSVHEHLLRFRADLDHIDERLRTEASDFLTRACGLPQVIGAAAEDLYGSIVIGCRNRWQALAGTPPQLSPAVDSVECLLDQQRKDLARLLDQVEIGTRRWLSGAQDRLEQMARDIDALGIDQTLTRGFVLAVDDERRIIRTAESASRAKNFELLFRDGSVACRPV